MTSELRLGLLYPALQSMQTAGLLVTACWQLALHRSDLCGHDSYISMLVMQVCSCNILPKFETEGSPLTALMMPCSHVAVVLHVVQPVAQSSTREESNLDDLVKRRSRRPSETKPKNGVYHNIILFSQWLQLEIINGRHGYIQCLQLRHQSFIQGLICLLGVEELHPPIWS